MKTKLLTLILTFIFSITIVLAQTQIEIKADSNTPQYACPKTGYAYYIDSQSSYGKIKWTVTGGHFNSAGSNTNVIESYTANVMVYWNNIAYKEDSIPKGTLKVEVYDKYNTNTIIAVSKPEYTQIVKSLDNIFSSHS